MRLSIFAMFLALLAGCSGPKYAEVRGKITVDGKAVTEGMVMFHPDNGPTAVGAIQKDGTYVLKTVDKNGALVGNHKVTIEATSVGAGRLEEPKSLSEELERSRKPGEKWLVPGEVTRIVPERYSKPESSDLTAEVKSENNTINFDVPGK